MSDDLGRLEELLRESRPDDHDAPNPAERWRAILAAQRKRRRAAGVSWQIGWIWTLASIVLLSLAILVMLWLAGL